MSYSDFTIQSVVDLLGYAIEWRPFVESLGATAEPPSDELLAALHLLRTAAAFHSELSRDVTLVGPILAEAALKSRTRLFIGETLDVDAKSGLTGVVDFVFATREMPGGIMVRPILCVVEAKRAEIDTRAYGQCSAAMIAAQRANGDEAPVHGCVTTGNTWQLMRLSGKLVEVEPTLYYDKELPALLGILLAFLRRAVP